MFAAFGRIGIVSFGGPAAQISVMHEELVTRRGWIGEQGFLGALSFCMLLPGPEAMQLSTYCGWLLRGVAGGLLAGLLFVLPGALVIGALAILYLEWGAVPLVQQAFLGIKALVVAIVVQALIRLSRKALTGRDARILALLAFLAIFALGLPFPLIVLGAGLWGFLRGTTPTVPPAPAAAHRAPPRLGQTLRMVALWLVLWVTPTLALWVAGSEFLAELGFFFSKLAVVSFGGAYALLAWMTQTVVQDHAWLSAEQMIDALGLAETTPGPLILVTQFVGMLAAALRHGPIYGAGAGLLVLWVTFVPCFLWIFAFAPHVERLLAHPRLASGLRAITAAVVGIIASLAVWFTLHLIFDVVQTYHALPWPRLTSVQPVAVLLLGLAGWLIFALRLGLLPALACMALAGLACGRWMG
ncbi:chromate efflux transporter [Pseudooceanicola sediminis]|uniref:Chromate efflux transporter n=1 Tax=Pseudooceanicola sediminis TaxID=2211117 RepID=A0A399J2R9_9RHOB|nr:chromate efflux transporter [Pseudooceanicola sediminis]KAA2317490.1 chromate efflux transporter [Puniceibacterium sp. HSS470]RII39614.1 chromate efflux transporter [Pseudooceanicola sediminis]|tara:strand:+ start:11554 stop:12792 length:1239 start_codon:yes stop_codon:yes gene_type:complete